MDNFLDKAQEKVEEAQQEDQEAVGAKAKQSYANEPDSGQGSGEADQAPNPTKAAEDVD